MHGSCNTMDRVHKPRESKPGVPRPSSTCTRTTVGCHQGGWEAESRGLVSRDDLASDSGYILAPLSFSRPVRPAVGTMVDAPFLQDSGRCPMTGCGTL